MNIDDDPDDEELSQLFPPLLLLQTKFTRTKTTHIMHVWAILHIFLQSGSKKLTFTYFEANKKKYIGVKHCGEFLGG